MAAAMEMTSTAPAATSLACPARGWRPGEARSVSRSMAVLKSSAPITLPMQTITRHHSMRLIPSQNPAHTTARAAIR